MAWRWGRPLCTYHQNRKPVGSGPKIDFMINMAENTRAKDLDADSSDELLQMPNFIPCRQQVFGPQAAGFGTKGLRGLVMTATI